GRGAVRPDHHHPRRTRRADRHPRAAAPPDPHVGVGRTGHSTRRAGRPARGARPSHRRRPCAVRSGHPRVESGVAPPDRPRRPHAQTPATEAGRAVPAPLPEPVGGEAMTALTGAGALARLIVRRDRWLLALWIGLLATYPMLMVSN